MKKGIFIFLCLLLIIGGIYIYTKTSPSHKYPSPSSIPSSPITTPVISEISQSITNPTLSYCSPQNMQANIAISPAAGNIYGMLTIKNISDKTCSMVGNNLISVIYPSTIPNIVITHIGNTLANNITLAPNQLVYSQVHYPNGPQCQSGIQTQKIQFTYAISPTATITFINQSDQKDQTITLCSSSTEKTTIQIWNLSLTPITQ